MAFEEIEPKYTFNYNPTETESIRKALQQYSECILTGEAFHDDYCAVVFNPLQEHILLNEFESYPAIHSFLENQLNACKPDENIKDNLLTETLLFAFALRHPELKEDVVNTCKSFVTLARALNDSAKMWITCEEPFAINPLELLSYVYPEYGYLFTSFYVPYWDDEHMPEPLYRISNWISTFGITHNTLKAFCYCDNSRVREIMLGYDSYNETRSSISKNPFDLISYLRQSNDNYQSFLNMLVLRYEDIPYLPYSDDAFDTNLNPISDIALNMMFIHYPYNTWDDDFDIDEYFTQTFIFEPAEQEISEIKSFIEQKLGKSIIDSNVFKHNKSLLKYDPDHFVKNDTVTNKDEDPLIIWKDFITGAMPQGHVIWDYISNGISNEVLSSIKKTNIYRLADKGHYALHYVFDEECYSMESLWEDLHDILKPLYKKMVLWALKNNISDDINNTNFHRLIDVLFVLNDQTPFTNDFKEFICNYVGYLSDEEFEQRYAVPWFKQLEYALNQFSSYHDYVFRENIADFKNILLNNYKEALEILPKKLFIIKDDKNEDEDFDDKINKEYGKIEIAVVAVYLLQYQQKLHVKDSLMDAVRNYINTYTTGLLFYNLLEGTSFPRPDWHHAMKNGKTENMTPHLLDEYEQIAKPLDMLEQYIYNGSIKEGNNSYSSRESEQIAIRILDKYLKSDKIEISDRQKEYDWYSSSNESTQKLLCVAHIVADLKGLNCSDASRRYLRLAFHFAPVRTSQLLAKTYKIKKYELDNIDYMLQMLHSFKQQGLSSEGYWAYILEEFIKDNNKGKNSYFKSILTEWEKGTNTPVSDSFIYFFEQEQRNALSNGYELLPRNLQLEILDFAVEKLHFSSLKNNYDELLIKRILRELTKEKFTISDLPEYFKNRMLHEGHFCQYIDWDKWNEHPELVKQIFSIEVDKPQDIKSSNYEEELYKIKDWKYIILQKKGKKLIPFSGKKELWLIQQIFPNGEGFTHCHTRLIIFDDSCPSENFFELFNYGRIDYKKLVLEKTNAFLTDKESYSNEEVERFFRYGMYYYDFMGRNGFFDIEINDIIGKVSWPLKAKVLKLLGLVSPDCLDIDMNMNPNEYYALLISCDVDKQMILKYLLKKGLLIQIQHLSRKIDFSRIIEEEKLANQMTVLACIAPIPEYHPLILKFENHKSAKMRNHIQALKKKFRINQFEVEQFHIVDYGVYQMQGSTDPEPGSNNKTAQEPVCINQTLDIKAKVGMFVGFRFTAIDPDSVPKVIIHTVNVMHPVVNNSGQISYNTLKWTQNGYSYSNIFLGWHFENSAELIPGEYKISAIDTNGKTIAQKTFMIEV